MMRTFFAAVSATLWASALSAQELGTVEILFHERGPEVLELCGTLDAPPACGLRRVADHYCAIRVRTVAHPPCCIPETESTDAQIRQSLLSWMADNPDRSDTDVNAILQEALSRDFPCTAERVAVIPVFGADFLFPAGSLSDRTRSDGFLNDWWSRQLRPMGEGALADRVDADIEVYRMLVVPTWSPSYAVRVERSAGRMDGHYRILNGAGGYEPGSLETSERFEVSDAMWAELTGRISGAAFFGEPTESQADMVSLDGTSLVIEGVRDGRYHVVHRHMSGELGGLGAIHDVMDGMVAGLR